jgi:hypothetical protein
MAAVEARDQIGAEEAGRIFLKEQAVASGNGQPWIDFMTVGLGGQRCAALLLERPDAGIAQIDIVVTYSRENDGRAASVRYLQQRLAPSIRAGSVKALTRSTTRTAGRSPNPIVNPKPRCRKNSASLFVTVMPREWLVQDNTFSKSACWVHPGETCASRSLGLQQ